MKGLRFFLCCFRILTTKTFQPPFFVQIFEIMNITEKELEDCIWDAIINEQYHDLWHNGFYLDWGATFYRQVNFSPYGVCDLCSVRFQKDGYGKRNIYVNIYELKKEVVNEDTFFQAVRYAKAVRLLVDQWNRKCSIRNHLILHTSIRLIGKSIKTTNEFIYLTDVFENVSFYKYKIDILKGVTFESEYNYCSTSKEKPKTPKFDRSLFKEKI